MQGGHIWLDWVVKQLITEPFAKSSTDIRPLKQKNFLLQQLDDSAGSALLSIPNRCGLHALSTFTWLGVKQAVNQSISQSVSQSVSQSIDQNMCFKVLRGNWDPTHNWSDACSHSM